MSLDHFGVAPTSLPPAEAAQVAEFAYRLWNSSTTQSLIREQAGTLTEPEAMFAICNQVGPATLRICDRQIPLTSKSSDSRSLHHTTLTVEGEVNTTQLQVYYFCEEESRQVKATRVEGNGHDSMIPLPLHQLRHMAKLIMHTDDPRLPLSAETQDLLSHFDDRYEIRLEEAQQFHRWINLVWQKNHNNIEPRDTKLLLFRREWVQGHWFDIEIEQARQAEGTGLASPLEGWITDLHEEGGKQTMLHIHYKDDQPVVTFLQAISKDWKKSSISLAERHHIFALMQEGFDLHIHRD